MAVGRIQKTTEAFPLYGKIKLFLVTAAILITVCSGVVFAQQSPTAGTKSSPTSEAQVASRHAPSMGADRLSRIERILEEIKITGERSERRSYENKMMSRELIAWVKAVFIALLIIAASFPAIIWFISRRRLLGLPGLSDEVAATFLVVEERQAKLANVLKEIETEVEYLHSSSIGPDLKNLLEQAEKYLEQNKRDLEHVSTKR